MAETPTDIRALRDDGVLEISWPGGGMHRLPFTFLRGECPCAACVDENTGIRTLDIDSIPHDIQPTAMEFTGNYALKIAWSDGHDTGLYTWKNLNRLCNQRPS